MKRAGSRAGAARAAAVAVGVEAASAVEAAAVAGAEAASAVVIGGLFAEPPFAVVAGAAFVAGAVVVFAAATGVLFAVPPSLWPPLPARSVVLALATALTLLSSPAIASHCAIDDYDHNGSLMEMQICDGGIMSISYLEPRRGLIAVGVRSGTLLFDGIEQAGGVITGQARRFSKTCGPLAYPVTGQNNGGTIILRGEAPVVDGGCRITGYRLDRLLFTPQTTAPPPAAVMPTCPPGFNLSQGVCVSSNAGTAPAGGDWYAIAGTFRSESEAKGRAGQYGAGWFALNTNACPNMKNGYWIAAAGPFGKAVAESYVKGSGRGYIKTCH